MQISAHNVTRIELEDREHNGLRWVRISLYSEDFEGTHTEEITAFPKHDRAILRVVQPAEAEVSE